MNIGSNIRRARKLKDLTMKELGIKVGLSVQGIGNYERGEREPNLITLKLISEALEVDLLDLIDGGTHEIGSSDTKYGLDDGIALDKDLIHGLIMDMLRNNEISMHSLLEEDYTFLIQVLKYTLKMNTIILTRKNIEIDKFNSKQL